MVVNVTKICSKIENKSLSLEKNIIEWEKKLYNFLSLLNKSLTFIRSYYSEKNSLKIRKINNKKCNLK